MDTLSKDERERAKSYRFPHHKDAFVTSRTVTRTLLSGYLHCSAESIRIAYGKHGKPYLEYPCGTTLSFNLSHTADQMLIAIGNRPDLGVDIESFTGARNSADVIESSLGESELECLRAIGRLQREGVLLRYWTHKEAFLKSLGVGLSFPLPDVRVTFIDDVRTIIRACTGQLEITLYGRDVECGAGHVAALVADPSATITQFQV